MNLTSQGKNLTFVHFNILTVYLTNVKLMASREERKERFFGSASLEEWQKARCLYVAKRWHLALG